MATERIQSVSLGKTSSSDFQPLVIIQFSTSSKQAAIEWLVAKLQATRASGGAELEVSTVVMHHNQVTNNCKSFLIDSFKSLERVQKLFVVNLV